MSDVIFNLATFQPDSLARFESSFRFLTNIMLAAINNIKIKYFFYQFYYYAEVWLTYFIFIVLALISLFKVVL